MKSLARFKYISNGWQKYIAQIYRCRVHWPEPYLIGFFCVEKRLQSRFFFSSKESPLLIGTNLDESVDFIADSVIVIASSNGFLLCNKIKSRKRMYYVYNPATRRRFDLPKTRVFMDDPYVGFTCKAGEDGEDDYVSFSIVRCEVLENHESNVRIESFSSETNEWTVEKLMDCPVDEILSSSGSVLDGVFFWLDNGGRWISFYDSVKVYFWDLELPERRQVIHHTTCCLGLSGGKLCIALNSWTTITCWRLNDAEWVRKYVINVASLVKRCQEDFGLGGGGSGLGMEIRNMVFHPALSHVLYLQIRGKVVCYDVKTRTAQLMYDFGEAWRKTQHYKLFSYQWTQWPRLQ